MTEKPVAPVKKGTLKGAMFDLLVLLLMILAAVGGGYYLGTHQKLAVVELVPPGTPGAREVVGAVPSPAGAGQTTKPADTAVSTTTATTSAASSTAPTDSTSGSGNTTASSTASKAPAKHSGKLKYWVSSAGTRFIGYAIAVSVNGQPVDNFFAPGKQVDISDLVKKGKNSVVFDAKALEDKFNQHKGDEHASMTVAIDSGPSIQETVKPADVVLTYKRNAAETENYTDTKSFTVE